MITPIQPAITTPQTPANGHKRVRPARGKPAHAASSGPAPAPVAPANAAPGAIPAAPRPLGVHGSNLWASILVEYVLDDPGGRELLCAACAALDRAEALRARINQQGEIIETPHGTLKEHPGMKAELANRAFMCRVLQRLGLHGKQPSPGPGRPPTFYGWDGEYK